MIRSLEHETLRGAFDREREELAHAAENALDAPIPSCPGWTMATLVAHLGGAYAYIAKNVESGTGEDMVHELEDLRLPPDIEAWFRDDSRLESMPPTVLDWFRSTADHLGEVFRRFPPSAPSWTWWAPDQTVGFWVRRMAQETAIHRWDAQSGVGRPEPIDAELARDGIDEMLDIYVPRWCRPKSEVEGAGETFRFERSDGEAVWTVVFQGDGMTVRRDAGRADVVLSGTASDLILFLLQRLLPDRLKVEGNIALLGRYFDFVPPD